MVTGVKYHISGDGQPNVCRAQEGNCPLKSDNGAPAPHFASADEARQHFEKENSHQTTQSLRKNSNNSSIEKQDAEATLTEAMKSSNKCNRIIMKATTELLYIDAQIDVKNKELSKIRFKRHIQKKNEEIEALKNQRKKVEEISSVTQGLKAIATIKVNHCEDYKNNKSNLTKEKYMDLIHEMETDEAPRKEKLNQLMNEIGFKI